ncbi:MAG: response regulator, partial [Thiomicrorhabdus sp.]|nr:response regulator [Thiomicrorhabdus sp.]
DVAENMDDLIGSFELGDCAVDSGDSAVSDSQALILVVDDNVSNLKVATILLEKSGYVTKTASNGRDAIAQCKRYQPKAVLMDIEMPVMDGLEATKALRKSGYTQPILAYTGHSEEYQKTIEQAGMNGIIKKPMKPKDALEMLKSHQIHPNAKSNAIMAARRQKIIERSAVAQQFNEMINAHLGWKMKIRRFIDGADIGVTRESAGDYKGCALGKWYYTGDGQQLMHLPIMKQLGVEHMEMHKQIGVIMDAFQMDDYETLEASLIKMDEQSDKVVACLNELIEHEGNQI